MPKKPSKRMRYKTRYCCYTRLDRVICPFCGAEVADYITVARARIGLCFRCRQQIQVDSEHKVRVWRVRVRPTLKFCAGGSPAVSTIEEGSESGGDRSRRSSISSLADDDPCTPDEVSTPLWITTTSAAVDISDDEDDDAASMITYASVGSDTKDDDDAGSMITFASGGSDAKDDDAGSMITFASAGSDTRDDVVPARNTTPTLLKDEPFTMHIWEIFNENNTDTLRPATALSEQTADAPRPTSPRPWPMRLISKKKSFSFRRLFRRKRSEPMEPSPSLEDLISIPEIVPRPRAAELLKTLMLARRTPNQDESTEPITATPTIAPQEQDGMLRQHAADLHIALARLQPPEGDNSNEESASSRGSSFWSKVF